MFYFLFPVPLQWSYGVTCWEIFTCGRLPYAGVDPCDLPKLLERGRRLERPENAACPETMSAKMDTYLQLFKLSDFRYSLMLECWDSNPEDRPSFIKIGSSLSKPLMTMSGYLDVCLVSDGARAQLAPQYCTEQGTLVRGSLGFATLASQLWFVPKNHCYVNLTQVYSCLAFLAFYALLSSPTLFQKKVWRI